jgi:hypothetical protein
MKIQNPTDYQQQPIPKKKKRMKRMHEEEEDDLLVDVLLSLRKKPVQFTSRGIGTPPIPPEWVTVVDEPEPGYTLQWVSTFHRTSAFPRTKSLEWVGCLNKVSKMMWDHGAISKKTITTVLNKSIELAEDQDHQTRLKHLRWELQQGSDRWIVRMKIVFFMEEVLERSIVPQDLRAHYEIFASNTIEELI